ncbi:MAG: glycosyltransferase family 4 protein [Chloroflexi bacterium]|nr:glycosyltransferase family 4 protein [Chloroflexota bacterium]
MPKLHYISLMRLPTERAHGLQIMQNCEAFAAAGYDVTLWVSRRWNTPQMRRITDPYAYYGVQRNFRIRRLLCLDLFPLFPAESAGARFAFYLLALSYALVMLFALPFIHADVFYSRDELLLVLLSWLKPKRSLAYEAHLFPSSRRGAALQRAVCRGVGSVIAITPQLRDDLVEMRDADARRIIAAHDGIRRARFETLPDTFEARRRLGWDDDAFLVGYVGSLKMIGLDKGVGTLLAAIANVEGAQLALVGGQSVDARALKRQWIELGLPEDRLIPVGHVPPGDVPLYLRAFDVCAMPHPATAQFARYTSPLKLFEYMASACAIVASDLPGWSDVLQNGETALLVPPDNVGAWSAAIHALQRDSELRRKLGAKAREQVMANYTWTVRAKRILAHLEVGVA